MNEPSAAIERRGVVAVVIRDHRFLVIRRAEGIDAPGAYCFPGGGIEPGETVEQALVRELREELGADVLPVRELWTGTTPWGVHLTWWFADLAMEAELVANPAEVASIHWYTLAELLALEGLLASNRQFLETLESGTVRLW